eukprot:548244-Prymnesium_polylepis.1
MASRRRAGMAVASRDVGGATLSGCAVNPRQRVKPVSRNSLGVSNSSWAIPAPPGAPYAGCCTSPPSGAC